MTKETPALHIRPALPSEAPQAAPLIHAAGPTLFNLMFGPRPADVQRFFAALFALPRNPFSYEVALVAEQDGQILGLALSAEAAYRRRIGRRMFYLAPLLRGSFALLRRLPHALEVMACTHQPDPGTYYLSVLAVVPNSRNQGTGSRLLHAVHDRARQSGSPQIALHTEIDNLAAQRFYRRHGYTETHRHPSPRLAAHGFPGLLTMQRPL